MAEREYENVNGWGGNQPHGPGVNEEQKRYLKSIERFASKVLYGENHLDTF